MSQTPGESKNQPGGDVCNHPGGWKILEGSKGANGHPLMVCAICGGTKETHPVQEKKRDSRPILNEG